MTKILIISLFCIFTLDSNFSQENFQINSEKFFGLSWSSKVVDFKKILGEPVGFLATESGNTTYFWSDKFCIEFDKTSEILAKAFISNSLLYFDTKTLNTKIDVEDIEIFDKIKLGMKKSTLEKIVSASQVKPPELNLVEIKNKDIKVRFKFLNERKDGEEAVQKINLIIIFRD